MTNKKAVVLLSGGLDSCVVAAIAYESGFEIYPLSIYYGQRHVRERRSAAAIVRHYQGDGTVPSFHNLQQIDVRGFGQMVSEGTILTDPSKEVPANRSDEEMSQGRAPSYVPGRNTMMLAIAQSYAETVEADVIFTGVNAVDYSGYVDCRPTFIGAWNSLARVSTFAGVDGHPILVEAPLITLTKAEIVKWGLKLKAPLNLSWSCYTGGDEPCNTCDSCIIRNAAFEANGMTDPAVGNGV